MFSKPTAKPAASPAGQLLGLSFIAIAMFIAVNPQADISQKVHKTLGSGVAAVSSLSSSSPVFGSSTEPEAHRVSYQTYAAADGRVATLIVVDDVQAAYPDLSQVGGGK